MNKSRRPGLPQRAVPQRANLPQRPVARPRSYPDHHRTEMHPSLKAALILIGPYLFIEWLNMLVLHLPSLLVYVLQLLLYFFAGRMAASFFGRSRANPLQRRNNPALQYGAGAGLVLWVLAWFFFALMAIVLGTQVLEGSLMANGLSLVLFGFFDFLLSMSLGVAGAKTFHQG